MTLDFLRLENGRKLILAPLKFDHNFLVNLRGQKFSAMLPAFDKTDCEVSIIASSELLNYGCVELCFVGSNSEILHDKIDSLIEVKGLTDVVTTWHEDISEACEYFINASVGDVLVGLVQGYKLIISELNREIDS